MKRLKFYLYIFRAENCTQSSLSCSTLCNKFSTWFCRVDPSTPPYEEPKFIVFYSMLLQLFTLFCFKCKESGPSATMKQTGTLVTVEQNCSKCKDSFIWRSQPSPILGRYPIGNILLSFSILMAGASIHQILLVFRHLGLKVHSARTFFRHQKLFLFPVILHHWETYRSNLVSKIKQLKDVEWTGDGRFDSVGHSAKYGAYTMFCTTIMKIVHFESVQVGDMQALLKQNNIVDNSYSMWLASILYIINTSDCNVFSYSYSYGYSNYMYMVFSMIENCH